MPKRRERKDQFFLPEDDETGRDLMQRMKRIHPHHPHSVAVLVVSQCGTFVLLCRPHKVLERIGVDAYRVPVQQRMNGALDPVDHAVAILRNRAGLRINREAITYLGCGYTTHFLAGGTSYEFNKCLHIVACIGGQANGSYETEYGQFDWCHVSSLPAYLTFCMDERKAQLMRWALREASDKVYVNKMVHKTFETA